MPIINFLRIIIISIFNLTNTCNFFLPLVSNYKSDISQSEIDKFNKENEIEVVPNQYLLRVKNPKDTLAIANKYQESGLTEFAEPNFVSEFKKAALTNDEFINEQWHLYNTGQVNGLKGEDVADIISASWKTPPSSDIEQAIKDVIQTGRGGKGTAVFVATGNEYSSTIDFPASVPEAIAVGASNNLGWRPSYSNYGEGIDFVAPSDGGSLGIFTTDVSIKGRGFNVGDINKGDADGLYTNSFGGTSSATPLAAGVAALILSLNPELRWDKVRKYMRDTADKIDQAHANYVNGYSDDGQRKYAVSKWIAGFNHPTFKQGVTENISRLDVFIEDRPQRSLDVIGNSAQFVLERPRQGAQFIYTSQNINPSATKCRYGETI